MKEDNKQMKNFLLLFPKNFLGSLGHSGPENVVSSELWISSKDFFKIYQGERVQGVHENYINDVSEKNLRDK